MAALRTFFVQEYFRENRLQPSTTDTYLASVAVFENWFFETHKKHFDFVLVNHDVINDFLIAFEDGRSVATVLSKRRSLMALFNAAKKRGYCDYDRDRIRKIKPKSTPKDFWTREQAAKLIEATKDLKGRFRATRVKKSAFAEAYIRLMWDTTLRRGDMALLSAWTVDESMCFSHPRAKSGVTDMCRYNASTLQACQATFDDQCNDRKLLFPCWQKGRRSLRAVSDLFRDVLTRSGLRASDSCLKKLVRSSIMEADHLAPGTGWLQGHHASPETTMQAYANRQRANLNRPVNRALV